MSKAKSRQPSRQASAVKKNASAGTSSSSLQDKTTTKVAVEDVPASALQDEVTTTDAEDTTVKDAAETAVEAKSAKTVPVTPAVAKSTVTKTSAKTVPSTPAPKAVPVTPPGINGRPLSRDAAKYERRQAERQSRYLAERRRRRNRMITTICVILALALIGGGVYWGIHQYITPSSSTPAHAAQGSYQEPIFNSTYPPVDSVYCDQLEQSIEHIHAYVAIYIDGKASPLPAYIGIPQDQSGNATCYYWLHTHDASGIVHIESPSNEVFTFGQFRDEWDQQFASLGFPPELLLNGWKIWVNGKVYNGSLANVPLEAHNIITLAYNSPDVKPVTTYNWGGL